MRQNDCFWCANLQSKPIHNEKFHESSKYTKTLIKCISILTVHKAETVQSVLLLVSLNGEFFWLKQNNQISTNRFFLQEKTENKKRKRWTLWPNGLTCLFLLQDFEKPSPPQKPLPADPLGRSSRLGHGAAEAGVHIPGTGPLPIPIPTVPRPPPTIPLPSRCVRCEPWLYRTGHCQIHSGMICYVIFLSVSPSSREECMHMLSH